MVSIVVPVYNAKKYIAKTIEMVEAQTYKDWELILVDDCSRDGSAAYIEELISSQAKRIKLIKKERNEGAAAARNTGIDAAIGRYIAFLDADDVWQADKLEKQIAFIPMSLEMKKQDQQVRSCTLLRRLTLDRHCQERLFSQQLLCLTLRR